MCSFNNFAYEFDGDFDREKMIFSPLNFDVVAVACLAMKRPF